MMGFLFLLYFAIFLITLLLVPGADRHPVVHQQNITINGTRYSQNVTMQDPCFRLRNHSYEDTVSLHRPLMGPPTSPPPSPPSPAHLP